MCGRFSQAESSRRLAMVFGADADPDLPDGSFNVAPTDPIRIVVARDGGRRLVAARWDFRPSWSADARHPRSGPWINARAETSLDSPAFGPALRSRRCIVPADAFYEWERRGAERQPYAVGAVGGDPLSLAAIWTSSAGDEPPGVAVLTTVPNAVVSRIHDRMPVILPRADLDAWLSPATELPVVAAMLRPIEPECLRMWPVSRAVNGVRADGPQLLEPVDPAPSLGLA